MCKVLSVREVQADQLSELMKSGHMGGRTTLVLGVERLSRGAGCSIWRAVTIKIKHNADMQLTGDARSPSGAH